MKFQAYNKHDQETYGDEVAKQLLYRQSIGEDISDKWVISQVSDRRPVMISLCDVSGVMARPWAEAGYLCICVDIQHSIRATRKRNWKIERFEGGGEIHYLYGDARSWKPTDFDKQFHSKYTIAFVACFPPCTNLAGSGSQDWGHGKAEPLKCLPMLMDSLMLFNSCEQIADWSGAPYFLENPVGCIPTHHRKWDYIFQPWNYGDLWTKKTCLWTGNGFVMPKFLYETEPPGVVEKIWLASPGDNRQDERSETPAGFARAVFEANKNHVICTSSASPHLPGGA